VHDLAAAPRGPLTGVRAYPDSSLATRALAYLEAGPASSVALARDVLGLAGAGRKIAERLADTLLSPDPRVARSRDGRWVLAGTEGGNPALSLDTARFAVVDVETTGMAPGAGGRIVEIAVVLVEPGGGADRVSIALDTLVNPDAPMHPAVQSLTGITAAALRTAPRFAAVADRVLDCLTGAVFVGHNVRFDWGFVAAELLRARSVLLAGPRLCTVSLSRRLLPGMSSRGLDAVAARLGIEIERRHRAGGDARATAQVLRRLLALARERGAVTVGDLGRMKTMRNAECGVRNSQTSVERTNKTSGTTPPGTLRIPHSEFRTIDP
jgi:DNA polymerase III epsilon subunit family exonuclease